MQNCQVTSFHQMMAWEDLEMKEKKKDEVVSNWHNALTKFLTNRYLQTGTRQNRPQLKTQGKQFEGRVTFQEAYYVSLLSSMFVNH